MRMLLTLFIVFFFSCTERRTSQPELSKDTVQILNELETAVSDKTYDSLGIFVSEISFALSTKDLSSFPDGRYPWVRIDSPQIDLSFLIDKDEIVIHEKRAVLFIDYPLSIPYKAVITASNGFSRNQLINEISQHYYKVYTEEENTATIKTIPIERRKTLYNRNQTNGKYGIWGHDIADLALTGIRVYKSANGELILVLDVDS
jgi:hypothetical protein